MGSGLGCLGSQLGDHRQLLNLNEALVSLVIKWGDGSAEFIGWW